MKTNTENYTQVKSKVRTRIGIYTRRCHRCDEYYKTKYPYSETCIKCYKTKDVHWGKNERRKDE